MKHFVAISLVFFSLTQLARVERTEALKLFAEGYCVQQQQGKSSSVQVLQKENDAPAPHLLSAGELALIAVISEAKTAKYNLHDENADDCVVIAKPKNKSP